MSTLFASFVSAVEAEKAAGALLDQGARPDEISVVASEKYGAVRTRSDSETATRIEHEAKTGITTTTPADAAFGAVQGATIGIGVGILGAVAALTVPGVGIVIGGGALAAAMAGAVGTTVAGVAAGTMAGYLRDQGMGEQEALTYSNAIVDGGAILAVTVPLEKLDTEQAEAILAKYGAINVATHYTTQLEADGAKTPPEELLIPESHDTYVL